MGLNAKLIDNFLRIYTAEYPEIVESLRRIEEALQLGSPRVLYACSGDDMTPAKIWPAENITFVDQRKPLMSMLSENGLNAIDCKVEDMSDLGEFDVVYVHNSPAELDRPIEMLVKGGYVIGNNRYNLKKKAEKHCVLIGATRKETEGYWSDAGRTWFDDDPSGFFEEIHTFEDYQEHVTPEIRATVESIMQENHIIEKAAFEMLRRGSFQFCIKYGEVFVYQKK
ncbi:hypothetical protein KY333_01740 [Candidatus Woesearchaeota archaeon]|nr:hypothetical protein [Candidatus Woesearchaeota archaeon]MBW2994411.1 hypothetical protein [Candidatus Woesearchaeota archaeon]